MLSLVQNPAVELKGVVFTYGYNRVLNDADLEIFYGEAIAIIGRSGAVKTNLLKIVAGLLKPGKGLLRSLSVSLQASALIS